MRLLPQPPHRPRLPRRQHPARQLPAARGAQDAARIGERARQRMVRGLPRALAVKMLEVAESADLDLLGHLAQFDLHAFAVA